MSDATPNPAIQNEATPQTPTAPTATGSTPTMPSASSPEAPRRNSQSVVDAEVIPEAPPEVAREVARIEAWEAVQKAHPNGHAIGAMPLAVEVGQTQQSFFKAAAEVTLRGVTVDEGGIIDFLFLGGQKLTPNANGQFALNHPAKPGDFCIAIVKNPGPNARAFTVTWWATAGANAAQPAPTPQAHAASPVGQVASAQPQGVANVGNAPPIGVGVHQAAPMNRPLPQGAVTPGMNEVAILLKHGDAMVLLNAIQSGVPIPPSMSPPYIRAIETALGRP